MRETTGDLIVTLPRRIYKRGEAWLKWLTEVDHSRPDRSAFLGDPADGWFGEKAPAAVGEWLLHYDEDRAWYGRSYGIGVVLYRVGPEGLFVVRSWSLAPSHRWVLDVRDEIGRMLTAARPPSDMRMDLATASLLLRQLPPVCKPPELAARLSEHLGAMVAWGHSPAPVTGDECAEWRCPACGFLGQIPERCPAWSAVPLAKAIIASAPEAAAREEGR
ncbi:hypothetical protein [Actinomadura nitritigenes]|uniref:hypothetical protein n=1 Tax=Actinomadura nitritigenes TaxID=134602 RepID=UPI003D94411A